LNSETSANKTSPLLKSIAYLVVVAVSLFVALPIALWLLTRQLITFQLGLLRFLGFAPLTTGTIFAAWSAIYFPLRAKGTPAHSDPPRKLATNGLFRHTRNPMYLGATLTLIGQAILLESPTVLSLAAAVWLFFHLLLVYYEEPQLQKRFGNAYQEYAATVPRWLLKTKRKKQHVP
jgi:protein-S-isoprenylcysteine O-methyltransferase Ste14